MPLFDLPVVVPYRLRDDPDEALFSVQVRAIASGEAAALPLAQLLAQTHATLNHPGRDIELLTDRAKIGAMGHQIDGPYAYVINQGNHIHHVLFPARIDSHSGENMGNTFAGIDPKNLFGVLLDCHLLTYINTAGLASIAAHSKRVNLRLFRLSEPVRKVLEIVGLLQMLNIQPNLKAALADLIADHH